MVLKKLKLNIRCDYNNNKQMGEHSRHTQCKLITFVMVIQRFVITIMVDIELVVMINY